MLDARKGNGIMATSLISLIAAGCLLQDGSGDFGYLKTKKGSDCPVVQYQPREGDLVFLDDHNLIWTLLFLWAGTGPPLHMGIVVKNEGGDFALLEAGPDDTVWVTLQDLGARLRQFERDYKGTISIRHCKKELPPDRSKALTKFARLQDGKPYAVLRLLLQGTPLRSRGPIREIFLAETRLDRWGWICSELAVAAGTVAGLFPDTVKANVTYPLDLVNNRRHDLSQTWGNAEIWQPARKSADSRDDAKK
jgi:hypothetical protein